jgi:hypothetical protein
MNRVYMHMFIGVSANICINIYISTDFFKSQPCAGATGTGPVKERIAGRHGQLARHINTTHVHVSLTHCAKLAVSLSERAECLEQICRGPSRSGQMWRRHSSTAILYSYSNPESIDILE